MHPTVINIPILLTSLMTITAEVCSDALKGNCARIDGPGRVLDQIGTSGAYTVSSLFEQSIVPHVTMVTDVNNADTNKDVSRGSSTFIGDQ